MLEFFNNKDNNSKNYKNQRSNSDLINIKEEYTNLKTTMSSNAFNTGGSNTVTINEFFRTGQKKLSKIKVMNLSDKKSQSLIKLNTSKKRNLKNDTELSNKKEENKTESLNQKILIFKTALNKIPNITTPPKRQKRKKNIEKINTNKIIYYNSSLKNFYKTQNDIESSLNKKMKSNISLTRSNKINLVHNLLTFYKKKNKDKSEKLEIINPKIIANKSTKEENKENKENEIINKLLKGFSFVSGNKSTLSLLFHRIPIKMKPCLPQLYRNETQSETILNPIINSYGNVLDDLSEKIGFMKDSINMIYPRISKAKYIMKGPTIQFKSVKRSRSVIDDNNINKNKSQNILYKINKRKNIQTFYSKYPLDSRNIKSKEHLLPYTMYSLKRKK